MHIKAGHIEAGHIEAGHIEAGHIEAGPLNELSHGLMYEPKVMYTTSTRVQRLCSK